MSRDELFSQLVDMSRELGRPENDFVILGEGNTSAMLDDEVFAVKASGASLCGIEKEHFVQVCKSKVMQMLELPQASDDEVKTLLDESKADPSYPLRPSVETVFHASLLSLPGVRFIGHTHPTAVNAILCSKNWKDIISGRIFPDEIVSCGVAPVIVEYTDPGLPLAKVIHNRCLEYTQAMGSAPKAVVIQNHGLIALGGSAKEVIGITSMWVKTARVLAGAMTFGGINYFSDEQVSRIVNRPDEVYRMKLIRGS